MSVASCPSATKGKVRLLLLLDSSETALTSVRCRQPVGSLTRLCAGSSTLGVARKEWLMATTRKSPLAVTLKQNRPFVSLQQEAFLSILRTASELSNTADKLLRQFDITQQQYNVLRILRGAGTEGLCRNEISARMVAAAPDMSRLLDRMEKSGWITRERAEDDRRQVSTFITDSGKKLLTIIEGPVHEQTHRLFEGVRSTDLKMLVDVLAQIRSRRVELS
jgi:DNA-binding MarR family transcriptional regulator